MTDREMTTLREAAQQALEALLLTYSATSNHCDTQWASITTLRAALAEPQRKPLTDEEIEKAYREIWRDLPSEFGHTSSGWIEQGIRYAEQAHNIK